MLTMKLNELGAKNLPSDCPDRFSIEKIEIELKVKLAPLHKEILLRFCDSIVFEYGAKYKPIQRTPVDTADGFQGLEILYGLKGSQNLVAINNIYKGQVPDDFIVIGGSVGGNQICISRSSGDVYFWFHEAEFDDECMFEISKCIDDFIYGLIPDDNQWSNIREIDESNSFLDF
ncbi:MAG: SMI1/KNR4 family protein [Plesiomonas shigelloides]